MNQGKVTVGHPVDVATGELHKLFRDVSIPGRVELSWDRYYSTHLLDKPGPFGPGWVNKYFSTLTYDGNSYFFTDSQGAAVILADNENILQNGGTIRNPGSFTELQWKNKRYHVTQWEIEGDKIWIYVFNKNADGTISNLQEINDVSGQGLAIYYDENGLLTRIRQKLEKRDINLHYSKQGKISKVEYVSDTDMRYILSSYEYDQLGRLVSITDAIGNSETFIYDSRNRIVKEIGKDGSNFKFKYDDKDRCIQSVGINGYDEKTFKYIDAARWTEMTDSLGNVRRFQYNSIGQVLCEINAIGAKYVTEYDDYGRIIEKIDPLGASTGFKYDEFGNRTKIVDALGQQTEIKYSQSHLPLRFIDPAGNVWQRNYDNQNQLIAIIDPEGNRYKLIYDDVGNLIEIVDPLNNRLRQMFTDNGKLQAVTDWHGNPTSYQIDAFGRISKKIDAMGAITEYEYDLLNHLITIRYADDTVCKYSYDAGSNIIHVLNRNGFETTYKYAPCNRLVERKDSLGKILRFGWGSEPQWLETVTNAVGEVYYFEYNKVGLVIGEIGFDGRELGFEYDLAGNRIASINGNGEKIVYHYDALGRIVQKIFPDGTTADFSYDAAGFLKSGTNQHSAIFFERDAIGRILRETQNDNLVERTYDNIGNLIEIKSNFGHRITYQFDSNGLITAFTKENGYSVRIKRDVRGSETMRILPGGVQLKQKYNSAGQLREQILTAGLQNDISQHGVSNDDTHALIKRTYKYDKTLLIGIQDALWGNTDYVYDPTEQLLAVLKENGGSEKFAYDANRNITRIEREGRIDNLAYSCGDRLDSKQDGNTVYEYDPQGRLILKKETLGTGSVREWHYGWDVLDQLITIANPKNETWRYTYDAFGRRIQKISPDGRVMGFVWDGDVVLHETVDNELKNSWIFDPHTYTPISKFEKNSSYSVISDHLGTPKEIVDVYGNLVWKADYYAWGELRDLKSSGVDCPIRFQGQWWDEESGLSYNRYRYYDASIGRFIQKDPIGLLGNINLYSSFPNPIGWIDPLGLCEDDPDLPGDSLTPEEVAQLQAIADRFNTQIDVIGSRAAGRGRNIDQPDLPVSKGPGTRSDIDVRIDGQIDINTAGGLSDSIRQVGNGAGRVSSSTGLPSNPPAIVFRPGQAPEVL